MTSDRHQAASSVVVWSLLGCFQMEVTVNFVFSSNLNYRIEFERSQLILAL